MLVTNNTLQTANATTRLLKKVKSILIYWIVKFYASIYSYFLAKGIRMIGAIKWNCISFAKYQLCPKHYVTVIEFEDY
jgi:hypothetical protein